MNTFNHLFTHQLCGQVATLDAFTEAGVDPAFDSEMEEVERQIAEFRLACSDIEGRTP